MAFKCVLLAYFAVFGVLIFIVFKVIINDLEDFEMKHDREIQDSSVHFDEEIKDPVIVWWTPFTGDEGSVRTCGSQQCFFTVNRKYMHHPHFKAFLFYASNLDVGDLPVPRKAEHQWGLLHEESPKNNRFIFCHEEMMTLFNHTSTFKRQSDCPITTQYLGSISSLESKKYLKSTDEKNRLIRDEGLAIINFVQSDCDTPSDRDTFVEMLQRHLAVDSFGRCLHNKDLPEHLTDPIGGMDHNDFYHITAKYKFTLAMENAVCDDYITEKFWRPFISGSVPVVYGSPKIKDWLPDEHSAIVINDFANIEDLAQYLLYLNSSDEEYEKYLSYKSNGVKNEHLLKVMEDRPWAINDFTKPNFVSNFECCVCERLHEQMQASEKNEPIKHQATVNHYGCPKPTQFSDKPIGNLQQREGDDNWNYEWIGGYYRAKAVSQLISEKRAFTSDDVDNRAYKLQVNVKHNV